MIHIVKDGNISRGRKCHYEFKIYIHNTVKTRRCSTPGGYWFRRLLILPINVCIFYMFFEHVTLLINIFGLVLEIKEE